MTFSSWMHAHPRLLASVGVLTAGAIALTTLAFVYRGNPTTEVDLNDGSVWVTNRSSLMVGHFNHESSVLDGGLRTSSDDYDVLQAGRTVVVYDRSGHTISGVDTATVAMTGTTDIPAGATVALGNKTVAILDDTKGTLWVLPARAIGGFKAGRTKPVATLKGGSAVTVGTDGTVYAVSRVKRQLVTVPVDAQGAPQKPQVDALDDLGENRTVAITAVGDIPVVLDQTDGRVLNADGLNTRVPGAGSDSVVQQPSDESDAVVVATATSLTSVPLGDGEPVSRPASGGGAPSSGTARGAAASVKGVPAAPVVLNGCVYGAWAGSGRFLRDCVGTDDDLSEAIPGVDAKAQLVFRRNRDVVVLNDIIGGSTWVASDQLQQVDNWDDLTPPEGDSEDSEEQETTEESVQNTLPDRGEKNTPPIANDDKYGVRPGRTTILPVLDNDTDADGDVLTVGVDGDSDLGTLSLINDESALQVDVPENAGGSDTFRYTASDGRGGRDTATVRVRVHPWSENAAPVQDRVTALTMESGAVLTYNVLPDWSDPDGDNLVLKGAEPADGDEVEVTGDGRITYRAISGTLGRKDVKVYVSDGDTVTEGRIRIDVRPRGATDPVAVADHALTHVGDAVTVSPLVNDISSAQQPMRLTRVDPVDGADVQTDFGKGTFTFTSQTAGSYYVTYLVAAGSATAEGIVRVDVKPDTSTDARPVAVQDVALLPAGGDVLVNVLANDEDPAGGTLVVQQVSVDGDAGVSVSVLGHETVRIADRGNLDDQVTLDYTVSNGQATATGQIVVIPVAAPSKVRPPVADDDEAVVRAGDVVTIPVLDNDSDPNGGVLHVAPDLVEPLVDPAQGEAFVSQDEVRFKATGKSGTVHLTYEAVNESGQKDAGYVTIDVLPVDRKNNSAPLPKELTGRVLSGSTVRIDVPVDGIDPDGDSVVLEGIDQAPRKGRVTGFGPDYIDYEAVGDATGTDTFSYRVRDRLGKAATARVRVGIAPAASENQAPYAVRDQVTMRPGRSVAVPALTNDSDPDGDAFGLVPDGLVLPDDVTGLEAQVVGDRVVVTAPDEQLDTSLQYTIRDERGAEAKGVIQVRVDPDVPLLAPVARDDRVSTDDIGEDGRVAVDVLANDEDPDGTVDDLSVTVEGDAATVTADGKIAVTAGEKAQLLTYTITDQDDLTAKAFIWVPSTKAVPPSLAVTKGVTVKSGEQIVLSLKDYVEVAQGAGPVITEAGKVHVLHGNGDDLVKDQHTLVYTSADRYYGSDAISFEVTDGTGPDDPDGNVATLTLPITVTPPDNVPPKFTDGQVKVAAGEDASSLNLRALTTDLDDGDLSSMRYELAGGVPKGIDVAIDGQTLTASADASTPKGSSAQVSVRIDDGHGHPITGTVEVDVTASTRPLPTANDDEIAQADQGKTIRVDVLDNDFNPFPDTPLTITTAVVEAGSGTVEVAGDHLQVTPDADFVGRLTVRYRIQDATKDVDREVEGHVKLTVQGVPDAPGKPTVSSVQDRTVVLGWAPPIDNGAPITGYTVTAVGGGYTKACKATTCTLDGLTNNVEYNFTVTATNRVGESKPSPASETARPDARPDTPKAPTLEYGDERVEVAWTTPSTHGSPVESFDLEISPAPGSGIAQKTKVTGQSLIWKGLTNGTAYKVRVRAVNRAPEPSSWSAWSAAEIPARAPDAPGKPTTSMLDPVGAQAQMNVKWSKPKNNGDAISGYQLQVLRGSSVIKTITPGAGATSQAVVVDTSNTDYTYKIRAKNKAGWGAWSPVSSPRRGVIKPDAPGTPKLAVGDKKVTITVAGAKGNGAKSGEIHYQYSLNGGGWKGSLKTGKSTISGLSNGTNYTVRTRAISVVDGATYNGPASAKSNAVKPYGKPGKPTAKAAVTGKTKIKFSWTVPAKNGRAVHVEYRIKGKNGKWGGWTKATSSDSKTPPEYGYSKTGTIQVYAVDSEGQKSATVSASAKTNAKPKPKPKPKAETKIGARETLAGQCSSYSCAHMVFKVSNWKAGTYYLQCHGSYDGEFGYEYKRTVKETDSISLPCVYGYPGETAWISYRGKLTGSTDPIRWQ